MRVLTDPREIRAFRKKQIRKIGRMLARDIRKAVVSSPAKLRTLLLEVSVCSACLAMCLLLFVALVLVSDYVVPSFVVNW